MTTVSDNFLRANGSLGPNWTIVTSGGGNIQLLNHAFAPGSGNQTGFPTQLGIWAGGQVFGNDQVVSCQLSAIAPSQSVVAITAATLSGANTVYNYTLTSGAALQTNQEIIVSGMGHAGNNGNFLINALGAGTFTVANASGVTFTENGTGTSPTDSLGGPAARMTVDGRNCYFIYIGNNSAYVAFNNGTVPDNRLWVREVWKFVNGVATFLTGSGNNLNPIPDAVNDIFTIALLADKFATFKNNVMILAVADTALTGGIPGIECSSANGAGLTTPIGTNPQVSGTQFTNWTAQDLPLTAKNWIRRAWDNMQNGIGTNWGFTGNWSTQNIFAVFPLYTSPGFGSSGAANCSAIYTGRTWKADQSSTVVIYQVTGNCTLDLMVRASSAAASTFYMVQILFANGLGAATVSLNRFINGTPTGIGVQNVPITTAIYDVYRIEAIQNNIRFYQNGVLIVSAQDGQIGSGFPGVIFSGTATNIMYWEGDEAGQGAYQSGDEGPGYDFTFRL